VAPNAIRIPIFRVRWFTMYAITPYNPERLRNNAITPSALPIQAKARNGQI